MPPIYADPPDEQDSSSRICEWAPQGWTGTGFTGKIEDKYYPPAEYRLFSREQKAQHKGLRVGTKKQRKAAAAKKRKAEEITEETDEESSAKKKTGVQFGSDAWKGKGQK